MERKPSTLPNRRRRTGSLSRRSDEEPRGRAHLRLGPDKDFDATAFRNHHGAQVRLMGVAVHPKRIKAARLADAWARP